MKPLRDRIIVNLIETTEKTAGGIIIPVTTKEKPRKAKVSAIGEQVKVVKVDDEVLIPHHIGIDVGEGLVISEPDVIVIL